MTQGPQDATRVSLSVQEGLVKVNPKNGRQPALHSFPQKYMSLAICGKTAYGKNRKVREPRRYTLKLASNGVMAKVQ